MADRPRKKRAARRAAKSTARPAASPPPGRPRRLVVQYKPLGDPRPEQTEAIRAVVRKTPKAAVKGEFPGALQIEVAPESESELRRSLGNVPDWDVDAEGTAQMPPEPEED